MEEFVSASDLILEHVLLNKKSPQSKPMPGREQSAALDAKEIVDIVLIVLISYVSLYSLLFQNPSFVYQQIEVCFESFPSNLQMR